MPEQSLELRLRLVGTVQNNQDIALLFAQGEMRQVVLPRAETEKNLMQTEEDSTIISAFDFGKQRGLHRFLYQPA